MTPEQGEIGIAGGRHTMLSGDHLSLCKFGKDKEEQARFELVWKAIKWVIGQSPQGKGAFIDFSAIR